MAETGRKQAGTDVQGLDRGLSVLVHLNRHGPLTVAEIARGTGLARTTTIRLLATLQRRGFLARDTDERRYWLTPVVHQLADGYRDDAWIYAVARPKAETLTDATGWAVLMATPQGAAMVWRVNTDHRTAAIPRRARVGWRVATDRCASGLAFLAYCGIAERRAVLRLLGAPGQCATRFDAAALQRQVTIVRQRGFALFPRPWEHENSLAVPILAKRRYLASLTLRYDSRVVDEAAMRSTLVPLLRGAARDIATGYLALSDDARRARLS